MNELISQQLPMVDTGLAARPGDRSVQARRAVPAVVKTDRSNTRQEASVSQENAKEAKDLPEMVEQLNTKLQETQRGLRFSVDDSSGRIVVKVIDVDTDEVIRQIPSEEMLTIMRQAGDSQSLLFDDQA
jgi:flagellar protein FlaG